MQPGVSQESQVTSVQAMYCTDVVYPRTYMVARLDAASCYTRLVAL